jgi:putative hydrolase of the HAD superfamily
MMPGTQKPRAILFDLWGTLIHTDLFDPSKGNAAVLALAENPSAVTLEMLQELGDRVVSAVEPWEDKTRLEFTEQALLRILSDSYGLKFLLSWAELEWVFWSSSMTILVKEGAREALSGLAARGIKTGVVSNSSFTSQTIEKELSRLGLLQYLGIIVSSTDYGIRKPSGILFDVALRRLGMRPEETWFIGDNVLYDIEGPWDAGMTPVLYETENGVPPRVTRYHRISHWKELIPLLERDKGNPG